MRQKQLEIKCYEYESFASVRHCLKEYIKQAFPGNYPLVETAMNEAVNNAFTYGAKNSRCFFITLKIFILNRNKLIIRIKDEGTGFPVRTKIKRLRESGSNSFDSLLWEESGRGIAIMLHVMDFVMYNKQGNEVLMMKRLQTKDEEGGKTCELVC